MEIISYFNSNNKQALIDLIEGCDWGAAKFLATLLKEDRFTVKSKPGVPKAQKISPQKDNGSIF